MDDIGIPGMLINTLEVSFIYMGTSYKGKYTPKNPNKYAGDPSKIIYRSLWERKFMVFCDETASVLKWSSEEISIPYFSPKKKNKSDKTYLTEMSQWVINNKKWEAAKKFADRQQWEFKILTEKTLNL